MRSKDIKYLGAGLGIGTLFMSVLLGVAFLLPGFREQILPTPPDTIPQIVTNTLNSQAIPDPTDPVQTSTTALLSSTEIPIASNIMEFTVTPIIDTSTPVFTATPSPAELLAASGGLVLRGALTREKQLNLYNASLTFIAPTYAESKKMSVEINGIRFSDPNTTCGPLALAILQRAQIVGTEHAPHDFFLINPDNGLDRQLLETTFPDEHYANTRYKIKLNQVDWLTQPLMTGDFLYIYAGEQGNFEHMLVVTRVDAGGRAYSVTNYNTAEGFVINETLLYDPYDPSAGVFAQWTKSKDQLLGSTGFAGFEVWRFTG